MEVVLIALLAWVCVSVGCTALWCGLVVCLRSRYRCIVSAVLALAAASATVLLLRAATGR